MKYIPLLLLLSITSAFADFKVPSSVYSMDKIEKAAKKAKEKGKSIAFILTDIGTT